ncbi:hypothetical protein HBI29_007900 [Parastagonospora nodorum]|nr:hypothetical protein HBH71_067400 [Parastagonospora nodorum]KAH5528830.1 hypothetical protein HBI29_007900 [Parastagonospora nodorum]KAH5614763.1 hypothetical protein HBI45_034950 [Parastagonospora nodorum]KAH6311740.1 hypothetical protein HBI39_067170 [Parastagonospora nodorum]
MMLSRAMRTHKASHFHDMTGGTSLFASKPRQRLGCCLASLKCLPLLVDWHFTFLHGFNNIIRSPPLDFRRHAADGLLDSKCNLTSRKKCSQHAPCPQKYSRI